MKDKLVIITGPTASGKSDLAIEIAKKINGEIISCDSQQVYKDMNIGTNKVSEKEKEEVTHHLLDIISPKEEFNVQDFSDLSRNLISKINSKGKIPILAGGTGLYIDSILFEMNYGLSSRNEEIRQRYLDESVGKPDDYLHKILEKIDPETAKIYHFNEKKRIIRALEVYEITGKKPSEVRKGYRKLNNNIDPILFFINYSNRSLIYEKINKRVVEMIDEGLINEFSNLLDKYNLNKEDQSMKAIGYKEIFSYIDNNITNEELIDLIQKNTRHYAKRQITWMKKYLEYDFSALIQLDLEKKEIVIENCINQIKEKYEL